jgi:hypothetical protein
MARARRNSTILETGRQRFAALKQITPKPNFGPALTREQVLADWNQRILVAVKAQYGPDSSEFELVGGTRRSERKKPKRGPKGSPKT